MRVANLKKGGRPRLHVRRTVDRSGRVVVSGRPGLTTRPRLHDPPGGRSARELERLEDLGFIHRGNLRWLVRRAIRRGDRDVLFVKGGRLSLSFHRNVLRAGCVVLLSVAPAPDEVYDSCPTSSRLTN